MNPYALLLELCSEFVAVQPSLAKAVRSVVGEKLDDAIEDFLLGLESGQPVVVPDDSDKVIRAAIDSENWERFLVSLAGSLEAHHCDPLSRNELDFLARGLIWGTVLIETWLHQEGEADHCIPAS